MELGRPAKAAIAGLAAALVFLLAGMILLTYTELSGFGVLSPILMPFIAGFVSDFWARGETFNEVTLLGGMAGVVSGIVVFIAGLIPTALQVELPDFILAIAVALGTICFVPWLVVYFACGAIGSQLHSQLSHHFWPG